MNAPLSSGFIQWKGTNACIDLHCSCGHHQHLDTWFLYFYKCAACGKKYSVDPVIKLVPLTTEAAEAAEKEGATYKSTEDDEQHF